MKVLVATSVYESARPFLGAWIDGVIAAGKDAGTSLGILVVNDGLRDARQTLQSLTDWYDVQVLDVESVSPAMTRKAMIEAAGRSDAEAVIFSDCDDVPCQGAVATHLDALGQADFSYGNVVELGSDDSVLYFDPALLPEYAECGSLDRGNFVGFTNSAANRSTLARITPRTDVVLADWDFFRQAVECGCRGRRTQEPVARYRIADSGIASVRPGNYGDLLDRKCDLARDFLQRQPDAGKFESILDFINDRRYAGLGEKGRQILTRKSPWFRFVFDLYDAHEGVH